MKKKCKCEPSYSVVPISCLPQIMNSCTNNCTGTLVRYDRLGISFRRKPTFFSLKKNIFVTLQTHVLSETFAMSTGSKEYIIIINNNNNNDNDNNNNPSSFNWPVEFLKCCLKSYVIWFTISPLGNVLHSCVKPRFGPFKINGHMK